jgi:hypothetical protein
MGRPMGWCRGGCGCDHKRLPDQMTFALARYAAPHLNSLRQGVARTPWQTRGRLKKDGSGVARGESKRHTSSFQSNHGSGAKASASMTQRSCGRATRFSIIARAACSAAGFAEGGPMGTRLILDRVDPIVRDKSQRRIGRRDLCHTWTLDGSRPVGRPPGQSLRPARLQRRFRHGHLSALRSRPPKKATPSTAVASM